MNYLIKLIFRYINVGTVFLAFSNPCLMLSVIDQYITLLNNQLYKIFVGVILLIFIVFILLFIPVVHVNDRNTIMLKDFVMLDCMTSRIESKSNKYLPEKFFGKAKKDILILALTGKDTLVSYADVLMERIKKEGINSKTDCTFSRAVHN